ncbi:MAG TPA: helix-turn-helix domain-containing protein [Candidatus Dormibacteraeota bacterium]
MDAVDGRLCASFQEAVELLGKRWSGAIITVLRSGPLRYTQLALAVPGLSERLLSERLKELELAGVLVRRVLPGPPVGVEYELNEAGRDLAGPLDAIAAWARRWVESGHVGAPVRKVRERLAPLTPRQMRGGGEVRA